MVKLAGVIASGPGLMGAGCRRLPSCNTDRGVSRLGESASMKRSGRSESESCYLFLEFYVCRGTLWCGAQTGLPDSTRPTRGQDEAAGNGGGGP